MFQQLPAQQHPFRCIRLGTALQMPLPVDLFDMHAAELPNLSCTACILQLMWTSGLRVYTVVLASSTMHMNARQSGLCALVHPNRRILISVDVPMDERPNNGIQDTFSMQPRKRSMISNNLTRSAIILTHHGQTTQQLLSKTFSSQKGTHACTVHTYLAAVTTILPERTVGRAVFKLSKQRTPNKHKHI